jgi:hypothetical protein
MAKHHRKHKAAGGETEGKKEAGEKDFGSPRDDWKKEESAKPADYSSEGGKDPGPAEEAEEKKHGGKARKKRKHGGKANAHISKHHEAHEHMKHAKHLGHVKGEQHFGNPGKARRAGGAVARASGGRTGSNFSPLSSAHAGSPPRDHKTEEID